MKIPHNHHFCIGFTLLELLVVMVIIGLLASYVGPKYFSQIGKSQVAAAKTQMAAFEKALDAYRLDVGSYPSTDEGLAALVKPGSTTSKKWNGPYLKGEVPQDPWERPYQYTAPTPTGDYQIKSLGKDGQPGGSNEDADITLP